MVGGLRARCRIGDVAGSLGGFSLGSSWWRCEVCTLARPCARSQCLCSSGAGSDLGTRSMVEYWFDADALSSYDDPYETIRALGLALNFEHSQLNDCRLRWSVGPRVCRRTLGLSSTRCDGLRLLLGRSSRRFARNSILFAAVVAWKFLGSLLSPRPSRRTSLSIVPVAVCADQDSPADSSRSLEDIVCVGALSGQCSAGFLMLGRESLQGVNSTVDGVFVVGPVVVQN